MKKTSFKFTPISEEETVKRLLNLSSKKATGLDGMPARLIKEQITASITHIINLSLYSGNVPDDIYHFTKMILKPTRATIALCQFYQLSQKYWKWLCTTRLNLI